MSNKRRRGPGDESDPDEPQRKRRKIQDLFDRMLDNIKHALMNIGDLDERWKLVANILLYYKKEKGLVKLSWINLEQLCGVDQQVVVKLMFDCDVELWDMVRVSGTHQESVWALVDDMRTTYRDIIDPNPAEFNEMCVVGLIRKMDEESEE